MAAPDRKKAQKPEPPVGPPNLADPARIKRAERAVVGAALAEHSVAIELLWLSPEEFSEGRERLAWAGIQKCISDGAHPDDILVGMYMVEHGDVAPITYLIDLQSALPDIANARHYAKQVREASQRRRLIATGKKMALAAENESNVKELLERQTAQLLQMAEWDTSPDVGEAAAIIERVINSGNDRRKEGSRPQGFRWGWPSLDERLRPLRPGRLYTIGALQSVGKSTFALQLASNVSQAGGSVMFVSLEQSVEEIAAALASHRAQVSANEIEDWTVSDADSATVVLQMDALQGERFLIDAYRAMTIPMLRLRAAQRQKLKGLDLLVVDYLQLMLTSGKTDNRANEVAAISRGLKIIAQELNVAVVMCSQLSRSFEERKEKNPQAEPVLRDLAESSAPAKDSDVVVLLDRCVQAPLGSSPEVERETKVVISKQRHWRTGRATLDFNGMYHTFFERNTWHRPAGRDKQGADDASDG